MGWGFLYDCIFSSKLFVFFLRSNSRYSWSRLIRIEPNAQLISITDLSYPLSVRFGSALFLQVIIRNYSSAELRVFTYQSSQASDLFPRLYSCLWQTSLVGFYWATRERTNISGSGNIHGDRQSGILFSANGRSHIYGFKLVVDIQKRRRKMSSPLSANCRDNIMDSIGHGKLEENSHDSLNALEMWSWENLDYLIIFIYLSLA